MASVPLAHIWQEGAAPEVLTVGQSAWPPPVGNGTVSEIREMSPVRTRRLSRQPAGLGFGPIGRAQAQDKLKTNRLTPGDFESHDEPSFTLNR